MMLLGVGTRTRSVRRHRLSGRPRLLQRSVVSCRGNARTRNGYAGRNQARRTPALSATHRLAGIIAACSMAGDSLSSWVSWERNSFTSALLAREWLAASLPFCVTVVRARFWERPGSSPANFAVLPEPLRSHGVSIGFRSPSLFLPLSWRPRDCHRYLARDTRAAGWARGIQRHSAKPVVPSRSLARLHSGIRAQYADACRRGSLYRGRESTVREPSGRSLASNGCIQLTLGASMPMSAWSFLRCKALRFGLMFCHS